MTASWISGWPNLALSDAYRMSQARASSQPPPSAKPFTAASVGFGIDSSRRQHSWPSAPQAWPSSTDISVISLMSAPAANARSPAPVNTSTRAAVSIASSRSRSRCSSPTLNPASAPAKPAPPLPGRLRRAYGSCRDLRAQELDDLAGRRARGEHCSDALGLQLLRVLCRDRPSEHDEDVLGAVRAQ